MVVLNFLSKIFFKNIGEDISIVKSLLKSDLNNLMACKPKFHKRKLSNK